MLSGVWLSCLFLLMYYCGDFEFVCGFNSVRKITTSQEQYKHIFTNTYSKHINKYIRDIQSYTTTKYKRQPARPKPRAAHRPARCPSCGLWLGLGRLPLGTLHFYCISLCISYIYIYICFFDRLIATHLRAT